MGQGAEDGELHLHPLGEGAHGLVLREPEPLQVLAIEGAVPAAVDAGEHLLQVGRREHVVEGALIEYDADVFPGGAGSVLHAQELDLAAVLGQLIQYQVDGGALPGAVLADEAYNPSFRYAKGDMV